MLRSKVTHDIPLSWGVRFEEETHILPAMSTLSRAVTGWSENVEKIFETRFGKNVMEVVNEDGTRQEEKIDPEVTTLQEKVESLQKENDKMADFIGRKMAQMEAKLNGIPTPDQTSQVGEVSSVESATEPSTTMPETPVEDKPATLEDLDSKTLKVKTVKR